MEASSAHTADAVWGYLDRAAAPVAVKKVIKELRIDAAAFDEAVRAGRAFLWPKLRGSQRCWKVDPASAIRAEALAAVAERAMPKPELVRAVARRAHNCGSTAAQAAVSAMIREGAIVPAKPMGATALYYDPEHPRALAEASLAILREKLRKLNIDLDAPAPAAAKTAEPALADRILNAVRTQQPAPMVPVTVHAVRAALGGISKQDFDAAVLSLADHHKLFLTTHDHGWALAEAERDQLVWDGGTKLYVAVTLRD